MRNCTAAVARAKGSPFTLETLAVNEPRSGEILVKVVGVGLCHTDLVFKDQMDAFPKPSVLGHEGAGVVEAIGPGVTGLAVGDKVVLGFSSCGECERCNEHLPSYCEQFLTLNYAGCRPEDGSTAYADQNTSVGSHFFGQSSMASHAIVRATNAVKVDGLTALPLELLGPLGCGLMTGAGAVLNAFSCKPGSSLLVIGGGPVGLAAVMAGKIAQCRQIILVEPIEARRTVALELGATHVLDPNAGNLESEIRAIAPNGINAALDTSGVAEVIELATSLLASHGIIGLVGVPRVVGTTISLSIGQLMTFGRRVIGIIEGDSDPQTFIPHLLELNAAGQFPFEQLIKAYPLSTINEAIAAQARGDCIKVVLLP